MCSVTVKYLLEYKCAGLIEYQDFLPPNSLTSLFATLWLGLEHALDNKKCFAAIFPVGGVFENRDRQQQAFDKAKL